MSPARPDVAQRTMALVATVIVVVDLLSLFLDPRDRAHAPLMWADIGHALIAGTIAVAALLARRSWSRTRLELVFVLATVPFLVGLWLPQRYDASHGTLVDPFLAHRFLLLGLAVSAPTWRSGAAMIGVFTAHAFWLWHTLSSTITSPVLDREPLFTIFFAIVAGLLLYTQARRRSLEQRLVAAEARARTLAQVSRVLLALRDRANTPLQTLEIAISLLETGAAEDKNLVPLMRRAVARLTMIQHTLEQRDSGVADLDAPIDLEAELAALTADDRP